MERLHQQVLAWVALIAFVAALAISGQPVSLDWLRLFGVPVFAVGASVWLFDRWLWRLRVLQGIFVKRPVIHGLWIAKLESTWVDQTSGKTRPPIKGKLLVKQSYSKLDVWLETAESKGRLVGSEIVSIGEGQYRLIGTYLNEPAASVREQSTIHYGTMMLDIEGPSKRPTRLDGRYWTDRKTTGSISAIKPI